MKKSQLFATQRKISNSGTRIYDNDKAHYKVENENVHKKPSGNNNSSNNIILPE